MLPSPPPHQQYLVSMIMILMKHKKHKFQGVVSKAKERKEFDIWGNGNVEKRV